MILGEKNRLQDWLLCPENKQSENLSVIRQKGSLFFAGMSRLLPDCEGYCAPWLKAIVGPAVASPEPRFHVI